MGEGGLGEGAREIPYARAGRQCDEDAEDPVKNPKLNPKLNQGGNVMKTSFPIQCCQARTILEVASCQVN